MPRRSEPTPQPLNFEDALAELEGIVRNMESSGLNLEQSLAAYKRGSELLRQCRAALDSAEQQIRVLEADELRPLESADPESAGS